MKILVSYISSRYDLSETIKRIDSSIADGIHVDLMDGIYVHQSNSLPNLENISKPIDIHLMVNEPERYIPMFNLENGDWVSFHPETTNQPYKLLQTIKSMNCRAGLVISPGTPLSYIEECVDQLDYVTLMTVNPGFAGQKLVPNAFEKLSRIRALLNKYNPQIDLVVDGNTTVENSKKMRTYGANGFVVGSASKILKSPQTFSKYYSEFVTALN